QTPFLIFFISYWRLLSSRVSSTMYMLFSLIQWEQSSSVPQCLISSLETVEWIDYQGRESEKKVVMYLLENSGQLKEDGY
ncbi:BnaCnng72450D, partial [Brassica napus]